MTATMTLLSGWGGSTVSNERPVIDADAHVYEDVSQWAALNEKRPDWLGFVKSGDNTVYAVEGKPFPLQFGKGRGAPVTASTNPAAAAGSRDVARRLRDMDDEGIDIQVLFGSFVIGLTSYADVGLATDVATAYNDWLLDDLCAQDPARLKAVAAVPLQSVEASIREAERAQAKGAVAVTIPPVLGALNLDDPSFLPFFAACESLDLAVCVHGAPGMQLELPAGGRFDNYAQVHALSFPVDQMVAFTSLAMGGVLDRFPKLRVAFLESGIGWVPYFVYRVHEHYEKLGPMLPGMTSSPREMIERGQCYFSFECEEQLLEEYVRHLGDASLIFASDYPHWDSDFPGTVQEARQHAKPLGDESTNRVLGENAKRLYAL
jgi:predicted TIM-barrel fold metal-dependent hydrolase